MTSVDERRTRQAYIELFLPQRADELTRLRLVRELEQIGTLAGLRLLFYCAQQLLVLRLRVHVGGRQPSKISNVVPDRRHNLACWPVFDESGFWFRQFGPPAQEAPGQPLQIAFS
jgi:hypothetical protein